MTYESDETKAGLINARKLRVKIGPQNRPQLSVEALSVRFAGNAESYAEAAMHLADFKFHAARYFLFCHAFELILKSFILSTGADERTVKKIGHDLPEALSTAIKLGYKPTHPELQTFMDWLGPFHEEYDFRYAHGGYQLLPTAEDLFATF